MLIEQIDGLDLGALERGLGGLPDMLRAAVKASATLPRLGIDVEAELGSDHHSVPEGRQLLLVHEGAVTFIGMEESDIAFDGRSDQLYSVLLILLPGRSSQPKLNRMHPRPIAETSGLFPSLRFCIVLLL